MIPASDREMAVELIDEAREAGARLAPACEELGLSPRTYQRWQQGEDGGIRTDQRPSAPRPTPSNALTVEEREAILAACICS